MVVEGPPRLSVRWLDGLHTRHAGEPKGVSPHLQPEAGYRIPGRADWAIISLACGAIVNLGICRYAGKGQSELGMLRKLWDIFLPGDVLVADRLMCAWTEMVMLQQRGVDCIFRLTSHRTADFRRGMRLGKDDHVVKWMKPRKPRSIDRKTYDALPEFLLVRGCRLIRTIMAQAASRHGIPTRTVSFKATIQILQAF